MTAPRQYVTEPGALDNAEVPAIFVSQAEARAMEERATERVKALAESYGRRRCGEVIGDGYTRMVVAAYEQGICHALRLQAVNPYSAGSGPSKAWELGRAMGQHQSFRATPDTGIYTSWTVWYRASAPTLPDADASVLVVHADGTCEGFLDGQDDDGQLIWRDVTAVQLSGVTAWAKIPEGPAA